MLAAAALLRVALPATFLVSWRPAAAPVAFLVGMVVYTIGELVGSQSAMLLLTMLPPEGERGRYLAFYQVMIGAATALVPILVTSLLAWRTTALWWMLVVLPLTAAGGVLTVVDAERVPTIREPHVV